MKQTLTRLWRKPWVKVLCAVVYSLASILIFFAIDDAFHAYKMSTQPHEVDLHPSHEVDLHPSHEVDLHPYTPLYYVGPGSNAYSDRQDKQELAQAQQAQAQAQQAQAQAQQAQAQAQQAQAQQAQAQQVPVPVQQVPVQTATPKFNPLDYYPPTTPGQTN